MKKSHAMKAFAPLLIIFLFFTCFAMAQTDSIPILWDELDLVGEEMKLVSGKAGIKPLPLIGAATAAGLGTTIYLLRRRENNSDSCEIMAEVESIPADCGLSNGLLRVEVQSPDEYAFLWSTGATQSELRNLPKGHYALTITAVSEEKQCEQVLHPVVEERETDYIRHVQIQQAHYPEPAKVSFEVFSPLETALLMEVSYLGIVYVFEVFLGYVNLGDYLPLDPGHYELKIYAPEAGEGCAEILVFELEPPARFIRGFFVETFAPVSGGYWAGGEGAQRGSDGHIASREQLLWGVRLSANYETCGRYWQSNLQYVLWGRAGSGFYSLDFEQLMRPGTAPYYIGLGLGLLPEGRVYMVLRADLRQFF